MMDVNNLAVCLGPTFAPLSVTPSSSTPSPLDDQSEMFVLQRHVNELLAFLITYYTDVFVFGSAIKGPIYQKCLPEESDNGATIDTLQLAPPLSPQPSPSMHSPISTSAPSASPSATGTGTGTPGPSGLSPPRGFLETPTSTDAAEVSSSSAGRTFLSSTSDYSYSTISDVHTPLEITPSPPVVSGSSIGVAQSSIGTNESTSDPASAESIYSNVILSRAPKEQQRPDECVKPTPPPRNESHAPAPVVPSLASSLTPPIHIDQTLSSVRKTPDPVLNATNDSVTISFPSPPRNASSKDLIGLSLAPASSIGANARVPVPAPAPAPVPDEAPAHVSSAVIPPPLSERPKVARIFTGSPRVSVGTRDAPSRSNTFPLSQHAPAAESAAAAVSQQPVRDTCSEPGRDTAADEAASHSTPPPIEPSQSPAVAAPPPPPATRSSPAPAVTPPLVSGSPGYSLRMTEKRGSVSSGGGEPSRRIAEFARITTQKLPAEQSVGKEDSFSGPRHAPPIDRAFSERVPPAASGSLELRTTHTPQNTSFEETPSSPSISEQSHNLLPSQVLRRSEVTPPSAGGSPSGRSGGPPVLRPRPPKPPPANSAGQAGGTADATSERPSSNQSEAASNRISGASSASAPESVLASDKQSAALSDSFSSSEIDNGSRPAHRSKPPVPLPSLRIKK